MKYIDKGFTLMDVGQEPLRLLLQHAFERMGAISVHNSFEEERRAAVRAHLSAGFTEYRRTDGIVELAISREEYFGGKRIIDCLI